MNYRLPTTPSITAPILHMNHHTPQFSPVKTLNSDDSDSDSDSDSVNDNDFNNANENENGMTRLNVGVDAKRGGESETKTASRTLQNENDDSNSFRRDLFMSPSSPLRNSSHINETAQGGVLQVQQGHVRADVDTGTNRNTENSEREESEEQSRRLREEAESEALARQIMAEEAMASYHQSTHYLQENANDYDEEDLAAIRMLMAEEDPNQHQHQQSLEVEEEAFEMDSEELSYDTLLNLGERIGDVKSERWAMRAKHEIAKLPSVEFHKAMSKNKDENDTCAKCLVCQFSYEEGETLRVLPCGHYFHDTCVDQWLLTKDCCPYCRQCIVIDTSSA